MSYDFNQSFKYEYNCEEQVKTKKYLRPQRVRWPERIFKSKDKRACQNWKVHELRKYLMAWAWVPLYELDLDIVFFSEVKHALVPNYVANEDFVIIAALLHAFDAHSLFT